MKRKILANVILVLILAACSAPAQTVAPTGAPSPTAAANQQQAAKVTLTPQAQENYPAPATAAAQTPDTAATPTEAAPPTPYPAPQVAVTVQTTFNPIPDTSRYGIAKVDAVLDAFMNAKSDAIPALLVYEPAPCTKKDGLGGPPKCQGDEAEGTTIDVLPVLSSESYFLRKSPDNMVDMAGQVELLGVFSVKADFKPEQYYPAGKYGIVLHVKNTINMLTLRVSDDGIVRVDYITQMPDSANQPDLDSFLKPK